MTVVEGTSAAPRSLWRNGDFLKFWSGETLSLVGTQVTTLALPLTAVIYFDTSAETVGWLRFLESAPYLFFALLFGVWVDRVRRKPVMMLANTVRMLVIAAVPLLASLDRLSVGLLLALTFVFGTFSVLFELSSMSFLPTLVKDPVLFAEANRKTLVSRSATDMAGPGLAGVLVGWLTAPMALIVDAVSYLASLITLLLIRTPEPPAPPAQERHLGRELVEGAKYVFGHRLLRPLALLAPITNLSMTCVQTLFLLYAVRAKGLDAAAVGLIMSCSAAGAMIGALISKWIMPRFRIGLVYGVALGVLYAGPLLLLAAHGPRPVTVALLGLSFAISYLGGGLSNVIQLTLRQTCTPARLMGRMTAVFRTLLFGGAALGGLAAGMIGGALALQTAMTVVVIGSAALVVPLALSPVLRLRHMPDVVS
ncbi:MFS transporter [Actinoplanes teichomyceticus]|uniref:Putative MFS family arabinose efflux permease n=1 Tax=Actinoplanes teichomyceticus TaxID=1867 RepID=A0A561WJY6_ACTTI|nr:MFS transporter [Actinoplanes teichomyceticus]TWG24196.1 putative MFS family arabinose efflux permease [Actinoplanes teichomyceticus]GIF12957.1 MFS transporter [Actinoplanes teichomyceticus]